MSRDYSVKKMKRGEILLLNVQSISSSCTSEVERLNQLAKQFEEEDKKPITFADIFKENPYHEYLQRKNRNNYESKRKELNKKENEGHEASFKKITFADIYRENPYEYYLAKKFLLSLEEKCLITLI